MRNQPDIEQLGLAEDITSRSASTPRQPVPVLYHQESDGWWADSPTVAGWSASAATLDELRQLVEDGIRFALDRPRTP